MKLRKIVLSFFIIGLTLPIFAKNEKNLDVLPTMASKSNSANQVWTGAFQLVWNDLLDEIGLPQKNAKTFSKTVSDLNKKSFVAEDLSESAYYKKYGINTLALKKEIEKSIMKKFKEKSKILDQLTWNGEGMVFYSMLKKDFEFKEEFNEMPKSSFGGKNNKIEYFGAETEKQKDSVAPLFYEEKDYSSRNKNNEFAVRLYSKQNDEIYLYRTNKKGTLEDLYNTMQEKISSAKESPLGEDDTFKAPKLKFEVSKEFKELANLKLNKGYKIAQALERIQFNMDKKGVKLVAEATVLTDGASLMPRHFDFTGRYVIFIQEAGKKPYFALLVEDPTKL